MPLNICSNFLISVSCFVIVGRCENKNLLVPYICVLGARFSGSDLLALLRTSNSIYMLFDLYICNICGRK